jgi:DNA transformation protein
MNLKDLKNLGPTSQEMLITAGINTPEDLVELGPVAAYLRVKAHGVKASLNLLYAIYGALNDCHWNAIPADEKQQLLLAVDAAQDIGRILE